MVNKKKRKSGGGKQEEQPRKKSGSEQASQQRVPALSWRGDGVRATLAGDQALLFLGRGTLTVSSGAVLVHGKVCQAGDAAIELCADERVGGPLLLEPLAADPQVPLVSAAPEVVLSIASPAPAGQTGRDGRAAGGRPSFQVFLSDDPEAPRLLPFGAPWQQAVAEIVESIVHAGVGASAPPAVIVVCGSKKVGKSTFARQLVNSLLNHHPAVAFMDTDCGQTELTPPGLVSLSLLARPVLGPPHMHLQQPAQSYFVGDLSPAADPLRYLRYIREMYRWYYQHAAAAAAAAVAAAAGGAAAAAAAAAPGAGLPPLVVNTHGWVKGLGFDVLSELLESLQPVTHFVQLCSPNPHKNLPDGAFWAPPGAPPPPTLMWQLPALGGGGGTAGEAQPALSGVSQSSARTTATATTAGGGEGGGGGRALAPVESRALQWAAFAQQCIDSMHGGEGARQQQQQQQQLGEGGAPAAAVGNAELADGLAALVPFEVGMDEVEIQVLHGSLPPSQLPFALNCSLVGLCAAPAPASDEPGPAPAPCLGLGIVRAVDATRRLLYLLTDLAEEALQQVATLQLGKLELPSLLLQSSSHLSPYLCLFSLPSMGTGAGAIRSRNNLARQSQL